DNRWVEKESLGTIAYRAGQPCPSEIRTRKAGGLVPPGVEPAIGAAGRFLPLRRCRQSLAGPLAIGIRLEPRHMHDRMVDHGLLKDAPPLPVQQWRQIIGQHIT